MKTSEGTFFPSRKEHQTAENLLGKRLLIGACVLWGASLALPAFVVAGKIETMPGISVMFAGLIFGWWVFGWAAYANVFFVYAAARLSRRQSSPKAIAFMTILSLSIFWFKGVIVSEASGVATPVVSWGWGAVMWFVSMALLTLATVANEGLIRQLTVKFGLALIFTSVLSIVILGVSQRADANLQETEQYLPFGVAFTTAELSGVSLTWPKSALVPSNEAVAFDVSSSLSSPVKGAPFLALPPAKIVLEFGSYWTVFKSGQAEELKVRRSGEPPKFLLTAKTTINGATIQLSDLIAGTVLYEQRLVSRSDSSGARAFLPSAHSWLGGSYGVVPALNKVLGIDPAYYPSPAIISSETARLPCNIQATPGDIPSLATWVGKEVQVKPYFFKSSASFCSTKYVAMVAMRSPAIASPENRSVMVYLFDRETLAPIARFFNKSKCVIDCAADEAIKLTGVRIANSAVIVESEVGDLIAPLRSD